MAPHGRVPFPVKLMAAGKILGLVLLAGSGLYIWSSWQTLASLQERAFPSVATFASLSNAGVSRIAAARVGVVATDTSWRSRYRQAEVNGKAHMARLQLLAPDELRTDAGRHVVESTARMQATEKQALALAADGKAAEAQALLFAEPYRQDERALVAAGYQLAAMLMRRPQIVIDSERRRGKLAVALFCAGLPLLVALWIFSLRSTLRHINRQRHSDALVRESEERLSTLFEGIDDALFVHDMEGRILDCNGAACRRLGYTREELLELRACAIEAPEFAEGFASRRACQLAAGAYVCEGAHVTKDGTRIPVDINSRVIEYRGVPAVLELVRDMTERKRVEAELELTRAAADAANAAKSQFLANMSHEMRTPMNGIIGMTELTLATELSAEQREYLQMARVSSVSMVALIERVLDFSKVEAGQLSLHPAEFQLRDLLAAAIQPLAVKAREKNLDLVCHIPRNIPERLVGDPRRLAQIVDNLVGNAIKFSSAGEVGLTAEATSFQGARVELLFTVTDSGIGVPENMLQSIFEPFRQGDGSSTRKYGGTGLGLAISAQLAGLMGGEIWAEKGRRVGSAFHFRVSLGMAAAEPSAPEPGGDLCGVSVLVVDANEGTRRSLEETLSKWGMAPAAVDGVKSAWIAVDKASRNSRPFDLILADANVDLRERAFPASTPIIVLGAGGRLQRPFTQSELLDAVWTAMGPAALERMSAGLDAAAAAADSVTPRRVLVAEDNPVNQRLLRRMLEKRGHSVALVYNGREAVEAWEREKFDIVAVRCADAGDERHRGDRGDPRQGARGAGHSGAAMRLPICAVTANAMKGDRERYLAAGMDYLYRQANSPTGGLRSGRTHVYNTVIGPRGYL